MLRFLDHGENTDGPPVVEAVGKVMLVSAGEVRLRSWWPVTDAGLSNAFTDYSIIPSCIRRVRRLT